MNNIISYTRFLLLLLNTIIVLLIPSSLNLVIILVIVIVFSIVIKSNFLASYKLMSYSIFISLFNFIMLLITTNDIGQSFVKSIRVFLIFIIIFIISYAYKKYSTNKEVSYVISKLLNIFKYFGYNQNKMYTSLLLILNNTFYMFENVKKMYFFERRMYPKKISKRKSIKIVIELIQPFFTKTLYTNEITTLSLISKDYDINNKNINSIYKNNNLLREVFLLGIFQVIIVLSIIFFK